MIEKKHLNSQLIINILPYNNKPEVLLTKNHQADKDWSLISDRVVLGETIEQAVDRIFAEHFGFKPEKIEFITNLDNLNLTDYSSDKSLISLNFAVAVDDKKLTDKLDETRYRWLKDEQELTTLKISDLTSNLIKHWLSCQAVQAEDYQDKYQRSLADYQNLLKKTNREKEEFAKFALNDFLHELLPVYDHLKLSISSLPPAEQDNAWVAGVNHVLRQFKEVLNSHGVEEISTVGAQFDHHTMEAIEGQGGAVVKEISPGYKLNGRLLKPAKVIVASELENNNEK